MKKLLGIVVLGLLWCSVVFSKNYHSQIFGIKIFDDVNNYIEECDIGGTYLVTENCIDLLTKELELKPKDRKYIGSRLYYTNKSEELSKKKNIVFKWKKNPLFENYYLTLDNNLKIASIGASIEIFDQDINEFENKCRLKKNNLVDRVSKIHKIPRNKFVEYDYKNTYPNREDFGPVFVEGSELKYFVKNEPVILRIICNYRIYNNYENVLSTLYYQLSSLVFWSDAIEYANKKGRIKKELKNLTDDEIVSNDTGL